MTYWEDINMKAILNFSGIPDRDMRSNLVDSLQCEQIHKRHTSYKEKSQSHCLTHKNQKRI